MFTIITISLIWPNLAKFSEGQKETPYTTITNSNYTNNLIKLHSVIADGVSTLITPAKNNNQTTISNSTVPQQKQHKEQNQLSTARNTTTNSNNTAITKALHSKSNSNRIPPSITNKNKNENSSSDFTSSGIRSNLTQTASTSRHNYNNNNNNTKSISISTESSQNIVNGNGTSTVRAVANDATTGKKIENAIVKLNITFTSNGTSKEIVGHNGEATYSIELKPNSKSNSNLSFKVTAEASAPGYNSTSKATTSSYSTSTSTSTITSNSINQKSIINSSNTANFT
jgi:hypothetical protein